MLDDLKERVCAANLALARERLAVLTWGNASEIDRERGLVVIKPSGVPYDGMKPADMVVVDLHGKVVEGRFRPSSDTPTHLVLYKAFPQIGGVVHTHSPHATAWAQAGRSIPNIGTTHADTFYADVPVTDEIPSDRIRDAYEEATGDVIVETFRRLGLDPVATPGALAVHHGPFTWGRDAADAVEGLDPVATPGVLSIHHGPFTWGRDAADAVEHAVILEEVAKIAALSVALNPAIQMNPALIEKHYSRKHGPKAYYGQKGTQK